MKKSITFCILMLFTANAYASIMINFDDVLGSEIDITDRYTSLKGVTLNSIENQYLVSTSPWVPRVGPYPAPATLPTILGGVTTWTQGFPCAPSAPQVAVAAGTNTLNAGHRGILISFAFDVTSVSLVGNDAGFGHSLPYRDDESVTLTAYNADDDRIGQVYSTVNLTSAEGYDLTPATISLPGIRYVAFNYTGTYHGFYAIDNLEFDPAVIPTPSAIILGSIGMTFSGWILRRRRVL